MIRDLFQIYTPLFLQTAVWPVGWVITRVFLRIEIKGYKNIKHLKTPVIFAVNHTSELDPIVVTAILPPLSPLLPMFYTSREKEFYYSLGAHTKIFCKPTFFKAWGAHPVYVGLKNYEESLKNHIDILKNKKGSVCIFPEGRVTKDGDLQSFKGGVAFLAHHTQTSVVPVRILGLHKITLKDFFLRKRNVVLVLGKLISMNNQIFSSDKNEAFEQYKKDSEEIKNEMSRLH